MGVGNIYAAEALFLAGIRPAKAAGRVSLKAYAALAEAIKRVLGQALAVGGTTLRDFVGSDGRPGYFAQQLNVLWAGRKALPPLRRPFAGAAPRRPQHRLLPKLPEALNGLESGWTFRKRRS